MTKFPKTRTQTFDPHVMGSVLVDRNIPETEMQALMEADLFCEPEESWDEKEVRFEPLRDAIEQVLDERERWVIEAMFWRRMGLDLISYELNYSKTHIARIRDSALAKLRDHLGDTFTFDTSGGTDD